MNNLPQQLVPLHNVIQSQQQAFSLAVTDDKIKFHTEAEFAMQLLRGNNYLAKVAQGNQQSLADAVKNIAAIGISLNPASKHAYLVPRDNKVCLDIGYLGLIHLATESGAIQWAQAKHVYEADEFTPQGIDKAPDHVERHVFNSQARGKVVGVYAVAKTIQGDYLTTTMTLEEVNRIKGRSPSANNGFSPWKSDEGAMQLKTVIKRAYKQWPKSDRLALAVDYLNNNGEGIDFAQERRAGQQRTGDLNPTPEQAKEINSLLDETSTDLDTFMQYFGNTFAKRDVSAIEDLTGKEADQAIGMLKMKLQQINAKRGQ